MKKFIFLILILSCASKEKYINYSVSKDVLYKDIRIRDDFYDKKPLEIDIKYKQELKPYIYKIEYPILYSKYKKLNAKFKTIVDLSIKSFKKQKISYDLAVKLKPEIFKEEKKYQDTENYLIYDNVIYNKNSSYINILLSYQRYTGGYRDDIILSYQTIVYSIEQDKIFKISDLFTDLFELSKLALDYSKEFIWENSIKENTLKYRDKFLPNENNFNKWLLKEDELELYYDSNTITNYKKGKQKITIALKYLNNFKL